ncbi:neuronal acetylcholine receptor subunit alpha-10-like [Dermacentor variabilis]|uniref:neuronal acetylcholine receptor subunit alpha-10-like n=1 Tax=Dermacentor variabilis TaxID=34621 RepID=UPI003F5B1457
MSRWGLIRAAVVYVCLWTVSLLSTNLVAEADEIWLSPGRENDSSSPPLSHEKRLMDSLLRHYDASVRPVKNSSEPVIIRLGITLTQIFDLDEKNQVLTTIVWLDQEWFDEYLVWDPLEFGNFSNLRLPCQKIWLPDIVLYNNADDYTRGYFQTRAMIDPQGRVFWPPPTKFRSTCPVDVTYFPFDDQMCTMKFGSWIYDGLQVDIQNRTSEVDLVNYMPNGEWELLEARMVRNVVYYPCCPDQPFPDITVVLVIRRKTLYYMYNVVMPCIMMSVLTLLVFCLPPDSGEKIALGVTVLLAFSVFMLAIAEKMPETSESIPLLGIYLTAVMAITSISVVMTVIVLNFHYRGPSRKEVPAWLRRLLLERSSSGRGWFSRPARRKTVGDNHVHFYDLPSRTAAAKDRSDDDGDGGRRPADDTFRLVVDSAVIGGEYAEHSASNESPSPVIHGDVARNNASATARHRRCRSGAGAGGGSTKRVQEEVLRTLRYLLEKQQREEHLTRTVNEWRQIALVIDRTLFWFFLIITAASSICFLVVIPMQRRGL